DGRTRIAIVNVFGGQHPMKGFTPDSFERLAQVLKHLVDQGYGLVLVPNGYGWGDKTAIDTDISLLDPQARRFFASAPILPNAQDNLRQLKYFVAWSDLVVTVEGWMMPLAYALGKPYRLMMAQYSSSTEWHPHGRSVNQALWIPPIELPERKDLALPLPDQ